MPTRSPFLAAAVLAASMTAAGRAAPEETNDNKAKKGAEEEKAVDLKLGDLAPAFEGKDEAGKVWKSADHVGKKVVVMYFFPAALTGG
jgi:hypothetical protein